MCESSSLASGTTNGLYPIRSHKVIKTSGTNKIPFIAPDSERLGNNYELAWDIETKDMYETYAIFQYFTGQGISADEYIKYTNEAGSASQKVGTKQILTNFLYMTKLELKTRYYINSATGVDNYVPTVPEDTGCSSGACKM